MLTIASASGNVFAYLWADQAPVDFDGPRWARVLCPRGTGLGLDGLFLLQRPGPDGVWVMDHWEPDGGHTFCSNGTRAAAAMLPGTRAEGISAQVSGQSVQLRVEDGEVGLKLPEGKGYALASSPIALTQPSVMGWTGTPHLVIEVPDVDEVDLPAFAPPLRFHPSLPEGANVSILHILRPGEARIRSWERGVEGETLCCGQGCAAAGAWLAQRTGLRRWVFRPRGDDPVQVSVGEMMDGRWRDLWLSGPVRRIGTFTPEAGRLHAQPR